MAGEFLDTRSHPEDISRLQKILEAESFSASLNTQNLPIRSPSPSPQRPVFQRRGAYSPPPALPASSPSIFASPSVVPSPALPLASGVQRRVRFDLTNLEGHVREASVPPPTYQEALLAPRVEDVPPPSYDDVMRDNRAGRLPSSGDAGSSS